MEILEAAKQFPYLINAFVFCVGACAGSFLNVCIYRIPKGESIVSPPSHCSCGKPIEAWLNIPILAWFFLRGRAKCCGAKISFRYPLVEFITAAIYLFMWLNFSAYMAVAGMLFASLMIFCAFVDIDTMELPDMATVGGMIVGVIVSAIIPALHDAEIENAPFMASSLASVLCSITGAVVGAGVVYLLRLLASIVFRQEAMGEGDVILAACIGAFCGWQGAIFSMFGGSLIGCVVLLPVLLIRGMFAREYDGEKKSSPKEAENESAEEENSSSSIAVPFGPWLAVGALLYFMFLSTFVDSYFSKISELLFSR